MKYLLIILLCAVGMGASAQITYNPSLGTPVNKPVSPGQAIPSDGRSMLYDPNFQLYRNYVSTTEVFSYLNLSKYRTGNFDIYITTGGTLSGGIITGGVTSVWWFKDGTANANLVLKYPISSVNGQTGVVVTKNADSLKGSPIDTSGGIRNNYYLSYDSANRKWLLIQPTLGYTSGTGISIVGNIIAALNTSAIWNASQLRGRNITTSTPGIGTSPTWDGSQFIFSASGGSGGVVSGYVSGDTLYLLSAVDTVAIPGVGGGTSDSASWKLTGNTITDNTLFLGTKNSAPLIVRTNNMERMRVDSAGKIGIGISPIAGQAEILNGNTTGTLAGLYITHSSTTTDPTVDYGTIQINNIDNTVNNYSSIVFGGTDQHTSGLFNININPGSNYAHLGFYTNGAGGFTEKLHIYDDARVQVSGTLLATQPSGYTTNFTSGASGMSDSSFATIGMLNNVVKPPVDLDIPVTASGGTLNNGDVTLVVVQHIGWRVRVYRNYAKQSLSTSQPTYFSFNNSTGTYTFTPAVTTGESIQLEAY